MESRKFFPMTSRNRDFPIRCEPHNESEAKCKASDMEIRDFALSLAFIMRFNTTRKWLIAVCSHTMKTHGDGEQIT